MRANKLWIVLCIVFISEGALAALSKAELASLPPYCNPKYRETARWTHGKALHHYCSGLNFLNKYYTAPNERKRKIYYKKALGEINYHLKGDTRTLKDNPLVGDMYSNRAKLYAIGNRPRDALKDWYKAIAVNPRLRRAYLGLARYLEKQGLKDEALKVISKGLRYLPKSKSLQKQYRKLGGKLPYPEPIKSKRK